MTGPFGPSGWPVQTRIWVSGRLPAFAAVLSAAELMMIAAVIPRARLIAASAAPERAWWRGRSRSASRTATGARRPGVASARMASGLMNKIPRVIATAPAMISGGRFWLPRPRQATPATIIRTASRAGRCAGRGRGGRADRARVTGRRAAARAGHHAAPVAVTTASSMPSATRSHGMANRSIRCPAKVSRPGAAAIHTARPAAVPATAAMTPTTAPPVTMTIRSCLRVAPMAASMPSWRWRRAAIEAGAALGFAAARLYDELDPLEREKDAILAAKGIRGGKAELKFFRDVDQSALELLRLEAMPEEKRNRDVYDALKNDRLVEFALKDTVANVLCPAAKLWNTGTGANSMREALSLMGGYGITEDCPGFLAYKWMDSQLEATYEGPEAVQRRNLSVTMTNELFLAQYQQWISEMRRVAEHRPGTGACTLATAMQLWLWTYRHLRVATDADGGALYQSARQGVTFPLADALGWFLATRQQTLDLIELETRGPENPVLAEGLASTLSFLTDLCHTQAARAAGEAGRICAELVFGYNRHPAWDEEGYKGCYRSDELDSLEGLIPGIASCATDVVGADGSHPAKAGPCASCQGLEGFQRLRSKLDGCLTGAQLAKDRLAEAISKVMIPEALDYPR